MLGPQPDFTLPPFFVYIIESNTLNEVLQGFNEGRALGEMLKFAGVSVGHRPVLDKPTFAAALDDALQFHKKSGLLPIIHIAAHGSVDGIALTLNQFINWSELFGMLYPLYKSTGGNYLLCMSTCRGSGAAKLALPFNSPEAAQFGFVSTYETVDWTDSLIAFATLYHQLRKSQSIERGVAAMRVASGHDTFQFIHGPSFAREWHSWVVDNPS